MKNDSIIDPSNADKKNRTLSKIIGSIIVVKILIKSVFSRWEIGMSKSALVRFVRVMDRKRGKRNGARTEKRRTAL